MRVPYQWLKEYVNFDLSPEELAERLTQAGIEVETVTRFGPELNQVIAGKILSLKPHPQRQNLSIVETDTVTGVVTVVCGATNIKVGDLVALALPGARLPAGSLLKEAAVYGVKSEGMLLSGAEIGLDLGPKEGILILDENTVPGSPIAEVLQLNEKILTLDLTPNRSDCLGLINLAYEVAALTGAKMKLPACNIKEKLPEASALVEVIVSDEKLCPRFTARVIENIKMGPSPLWLQLKLLQAAVRPISNIVDITNYVMLEYGQPLHAYDLNLLEGKTIIVRKAKAGEELVTLDGVKRVLAEEMLVIADSKKAVGLAGVMGGEATEISAATKAVLLEAAAFHPLSVRKTARSLSLNSEASLRFERGIDHQAVLLAQNRAAFLISELSGGEILKGALDVNYSLAKPAEIAISTGRINKVLGLQISSDEISDIFKRLGFGLSEIKQGIFQVSVPLRRPDITIEEDLIEEVARLHGYDKIPATLPKGSLIENREPQIERLKYLLKDLLVSAGFFECISYSFINPQNLELLALEPGDPRLKAVEVQNPFSEEQKIMRTTLLPGLLKAVKYNINHRELNLLLFEIGAVYEPETLPLTKLPAERVKIGLVATGQTPEASWAAFSRKADFFTIKGVLELLFKRLQITGVQYLAVAEPFTHPTRSARLLLNGKPLGYLGELHPQRDAWEIGQQVTVCELDFELLASCADTVPKVAPVPQYPAAVRDLALVVPLQVTAAQLEATIKEAAGKALKKINLFDLYAGSQIPAGKRSLAYSLTFRDEKGTLTDNEVSKMMQKIKEALSKLGAALRQ